MTENTRTHCAGTYQGIGSQEAPLPDTLTKQSRHCNMCDRPEVCDRILPNTGPCGMNDGTPVISSASPLSEKDVACFERLTRLVWALGQWNDHNFSHADYAKWRKDAQAAALAAEPIIDRLSASAPSPEDIEIAPAPSDGYLSPELEREYQSIVASHYEDIPPAAPSVEARDAELAEIESFDRIVRAGGGGYLSDIIAKQSEHIAMLLARLRSHQS